MLLPIALTLTQRAILVLAIVYSHNESSWSWLSFSSVPICHAAVLRLIIVLTVVHVLTRYSCSHTRNHHWFHHRIDRCIHAYPLSMLSYTKSSLVSPSFRPLSVCLPVIHVLIHGLFIVELCPVLSDIHKLHSLSNLDSSLVRLFNPSDHFEERGLPATVWPDHTNDTTPVPKSRFQRARADAHTYKRILKRTCKHACTPCPPNCTCTSSLVCTNAWNQCVELRFCCRRKYSSRKIPSPHTRTKASPRRPS